jgi:hypothetical protein
LSTLQRATVENNPPEGDIRSLRVIFDWPDVGPDLPRQRDRCG